MLVIVGSGDLWVTPKIVSVVLSHILNTKADQVIGVRVPRGADDPTTPLERFVAEIAPELGRVVFRWRAETNKRESIYKRDYDMVQAATSVLAFFAPDQEMEGGTGHVVQAALNKGTSVEAYRLAENGDPELLGSDEALIQGGGFDPNQFGTFIGTGTVNGSYTLPPGYTFQFTPNTSSSTTVAQPSGAVNITGTISGGSVIPNAVAAQFWKAWGNSKPFPRKGPRAP